MDNFRMLTSEEEIKIFSDPYRMKIIKVFSRFGRPATVKEVADEMGEVPSKVHYHVKKLISIDLLTLDHTSEINGIVAKYYKLTADSFEVKYSGLDKNEDNLTVDTTEMVVLSIVDDFRNDVREAYEKQIKAKKRGEKDSLKGSFLSEKIYCSEEEDEEIRKEISKLLEKYSKDSDEKDKKAFSFFAGIIEKEK